MPRPVAVVAAGHRESARAGARMLARGGNAVDAACAAAFAAGVAEAPLTGPGAGGFLVARDPDGVVTTLDFFVAVPGLGPDGRSLDPADLDTFTVPFGGAEQEFHIGPASVAVPGMAPGLVRATRTLGRLAPADVVEPAIGLARGGVIVTPQIAYLYEILTAMLTHSAEAAAVFAPGGRVPRAGERFRIPELADTLAALAEDGVGPLPDALLGLRESGGLVTADDLSAYAVVARPPLEVDYGDVTLITNPPPSSGGTLIAAALAALDAAGARGDGFYAAVAAAGIAANAQREGPGGRGRPGPGGAAGGSRKPTGTTHVSVVDADGGMAALSSSCGSGSGVVLPGTGVMMNNMLGEEDLNPGGFGRLPPGVRMASMMAPTLIVRGGEPVVAIGSAGSNRLRSAILQTVVSIVDEGLDLGDAVARPRIHPERGGIDVEAGVPEAAVERLRPLGQELRRWDARNLYFGGVAVAGFGPRGLTGAGDPRRGGAAAGITTNGEVVDL